MIGTAETHGAVSVVNAIAGGRGATVGVELRTAARVDVERLKGTWRTTINGEDSPSELAARSVNSALKLLGKDPARYSGSIATTTEAPIGAGLKTSSSSSLAVCLAVLSAFGLTGFEAKVVLDCSVESSLATGVSITGALDDAASCLLGGVNFADNSRGLIIGRRPLGARLPVVIGIPPTKSSRTKVKAGYVREFAKIADSIFDIGRSGRLWKAMTLNGLLYSSVYGYDPLPAVNAVEAGALGAGLSGTGPAVAAVFDDELGAHRLQEAWADEGIEVIASRTTDEGARIG